MRFQPCVPSFTFCGRKLETQSEKANSKHHSIKYHNFNAYNNKMQDFDFELEKVKEIP